MIEEHMKNKNQSPPNVYKYKLYKPKRYYQHSSMEFDQDNTEFKKFGYYKNQSQVNGNVQSLRNSAGN